MSEIYVECTCYDCSTEFDESDDCINCSVCDNEICENCQDEHGKNHCFELKDAIKKPEEKKGKKK